MSFPRLSRLLRIQTPSPSTLLAIGVTVAVLLPLAYGAGRTHRADNHTPVPGALTYIEQNKNNIHRNRLEALARHSFATESPALPLPRPKPHGLRNRQTSALQQAAARIAVREGVPADLFLALVFTESSFNPRARSRVGAIGLAQLMPATARELGVNPHDPMENLTGGARYLRLQFERFGSWQLALAAYNAGPGRVRRAGGVPNIRETRNYVNKIITLAALDV